MFGPWQKKVSELEMKISEQVNIIEEAEQHAINLFKHGREQAEQVDTYFEKFLRKNLDETSIENSNLKPPSTCGWDDNVWASWTFDTTLLTPEICTGCLVERRGGGSYGFKIPVYIPFIGQNKTIIIVGKNHNIEECHLLLQSLLIRIALMLPHQCRLTLLDPVGHGQAFPMSQYLPSVREGTGDPRQDIEGTIQDMRRIIGTYLDASTPSFEKIPEVIRSSEGFEFIFAANFPRNYDRRSIEALQSLGTNGPNAGRYLVIHYNTNQELPRDISMADFENAYYINPFKGIGGYSASNLEFIPDKAPPPNMQKDLLDRLRASKPKEQILKWNEIVGLPENQWWINDSSTIIETPIGGRGASETLNLWFGINNHDRRPCAHGMLGAMTGAGKSNLYHVFILGLAIRYNPEELRLYLIDGKDGVEFQPYRQLPHVEVVSLRSAPQLSRSILTELIDEKERRNSLFTEVGVRDFSAYREKGQPKGKLARIILLVDEYQELFEGDKDGIASAQLLQLSQQGRSAGIHMLLASQRFGAAGMLNQTGIFGNIHLRIAMQMTLSDRQALNEFGREGKQLIETCNLPGKIVVNDQSGDDGANHLGKVAFIKEEIDELIQKLNQKAIDDLPPESVPLTVIFDGKAQPNFIENPQIAFLLERPHRLTSEEWEAFARRPIHEGGLDIVDWFGAEHPNVMWLGQEYTVRGQAKIMLRRRIGEHVLVIGNTNTARYGMLTSMICSLAIKSEPKDVQFFILDRSVPGTQWNQALKNTCNEVLIPANFKVEFHQRNQAAEMLIETVSNKLEKRSKMDEDDLISLPSIFLILTDIDRVDDLIRKVSEFGKTTPPLGEKIKKILMTGPSLGIHIIASFSDIGTMKAIFDERRDLEHFRHRIALEMSEDDSFTFVRNRAASQLQLDGPLPISSLYVDIQKNILTRFKPYSTESTIDFVEQLKQIGNQLKEWSDT